MVTLQSQFNVTLSAILFRVNVVALLFFGATLQRSSLFIQHYVAMTLSFFFVRHLTSGHCPVEIFCFDFKLHPNFNRRRKMLRSTGRALLRNRTLACLFALTGRPPLVGSVSIALERALRRLSSKSHFRRYVKFNTALASRLALIQKRALLRFSHGS